MTSDKNTAPDHVKVLTGKELGEQIRQVCRGENAILAVAFWGKNAFTNLGLNREDVKIVLDVSAGGTNPTEFDTMKSSLGKRLHVLNHLHAKLYASDAGAVITSANASDNGLNLNGARLAEAGIYFPSGTAEAKSIREMAKAFYERGPEASEEDLNRCWELCGRDPRTRVGLPEGNISLLDALTKAPELLNRYPFILTNAILRKPVINDSYRENRNELQEPGERLPEDFDNTVWEVVNWELSLECVSKECIIMHKRQNGDVTAAVVVPRPPVGGWTFAKYAGWEGRGLTLSAQRYCSPINDRNLTRAIEGLLQQRRREVWLRDIHEGLKSS